MTWECLPCYTGDKQRAGSMAHLHQRKEKGMTVPELQHPHARRIAWPQWAFATATGSTLGAVLGGALIRAWLQPTFGANNVVTSPLEVAAVYAAVHIPSTAVALGVWGAGIGMMQALMLRRSSPTQAGC